MKANVNFPQKPLPQVTRLSDLPKDDHLLSFDLAEHSSCPSKQTDEAQKKYYTSSLFSQMEGNPNNQFYFTSIIVPSKR